MFEHLYDKIEFPLFLTRYLDFSFTEYYDIRFVKTAPTIQPIVKKRGNFGTPEWFLEEDKFIVTEDDINPKHLNLWYFYKNNWVNISKMTTEHSLDRKFIKEFNKDIKQVPFYTIENE